MKKTTLQTNLKLNKTYHWGILGCGKIAAKFSTDLKRIPQAVLYAVASRSKKKASEFAEEHDFQKSYGSYEELVQDSLVDIIYIATPHSHHMEHSILAMQAGKHVLCEKAFALNAHQVKRMISVAKENKVFLMEAFWTRFKPKFLKALAIKENMDYGKLEFLKSDFLFNGPYDPTNRLYNLELGGGSLLDIGIYPVFTALMFLGKPDEIQALAQFSPTGTEKSIAIIFKYKNGALASMNSSFEAWSTNHTELCFEGASIKYSRDESEDLLLFQNKNTSQIAVDKIEGIGYHYEASHVMECLDKKLMESPMLPLKFSLDLMEILDSIRQQIKQYYPVDKNG